MTHNTTKYTHLLSQIPKVDSILEDNRIKKIISVYSRGSVIEKLRKYLDQLRTTIITGSFHKESLNGDILISDFIKEVEKQLNEGVKPAVNGMGIILHTGMGRAPLAESARKNLARSVNHYSTLQINLITGKRGDRYATVEKLLCEITGAEAALVVNNNAAATLLILNTLAQGKEVIISRGELVEIGGSFRIPDVMRRSGAILVETGASNRTHLKDYISCITEQTGMILKVHQSNYRIIGFSKQVPISSLAELAHKNNIIAVDDLGSGALVDLSKWGLPKEPMVQESITAGADAVCFSGDKLLGGPQSGIIVGKKEIIDKIKRNQLTRALRCGKMTFAVLEATLRLFKDEKKLLQEHPVMKMLTEPQTKIKRRCHNLKRSLNMLKNHRLHIEVLEEVSEIGSGSLAGYTIPTWVLSINIKGLSAESLAKKMRTAEIPVIGRIKHDNYFLDCRTILKNEHRIIKQNISEILQTSNKEK